MKNRFDAKSVSSPKGLEVRGLNTGSRFASIDLGSHTIRLLVAELVKPLCLAPILLDREITRLARGFSTGGVLCAGPVEASWVVLRDYVRRGRELGVSIFTCGATGVVRRAANGGEFLLGVTRETGILPFIVSETSEARLSAKGILSVLECPGDLMLTFDLGGSSTEFVLLDRRRAEPIWSTSLFVGATTLTERFLSGDPPGAAVTREAEAAVSRLLEPVVATVTDLITYECDNEPWTLVGTAGTVTTLAAIVLGMEHYEPYRVNNLALETHGISAMVKDFSERSLASRRGIPGLEEGREDIILGGAVIVRAILEAFGKSEFRVTDAGFLEGLLLDLLERESQAEAGLASPFGWEM